MNYCQSFLHHLTDMGSLLRIEIGTQPNYKKDPYVHCSGSPNNKANTDSSVYKY